MAVKQIFNFDATVVNPINGETIKDDKGKELPLRHFVATALVQDEQSEGLSFEEKDKRYKLAQRVVAGGTIKLTMEEVNLIKRQVTKNLTVIVVGQISAAIDADEPQELPKANAA